MAPHREVGVAVVQLQRQIADRMREIDAFRTVQAADNRNGAGAQETIYRVADLELDQGRHRAFRGEQRIDLTTKEFALLHLLMRQSGEVLSRTQIISLVWDMNFDCDTNVVEVSIRRLRAKIDDPFDKKLIHTLRGVGYVLEARE